MITKQQIDSYIVKIPPAPKALRETLLELNKGDLVKAAQVAKEDKSLCLYLKVLINKPIYGFRNEVNEISQIFGILGVNRSQQAVYNYMMTLLSPSKWVVFKLNRSLFYTLQADLSMDWKKILTHLKIEEKDILSAISLLPASIIVSEALFNSNINDVNILRTASSIDLNTTLLRLTGLDIFDICESIAHKWELPQDISLIIQSASGVKPSENKDIDILGKWMHLLLFYTLSKPAYIEAGLNDFIDFQIDYVNEIYEEFSNLMAIS